MGVLLYKATEEARVDSVGVQRVNVGRQQATRRKPATGVSGLVGRAPSPLAGAREENLTLRRLFEDLTIALSNLKWFGIRTAELRFYGVDRLPPPLDATRSVVLDVWIFY